MARPTSKNDLLEQSEKNYNELFDLINAYTPEEKLEEFPSQFMNRDIRDVLAHLHAWHLLMMKWYETGMSGKMPIMPDDGYSWKTTPDLNKVIQQKYHSASLEEIIKLLDDSHKKVTRLIEKHSNEELFEKKRYKWTGTTSLGAYFISSTSSHYDWALKLVKKAKK